jgi:DNA helicase-2/ATP-dependent DNA helicase PcrA
LDYDDLLVRSVQLLQTHPACVSNIESVLVDEFQDTNTIQYELMNLFASNKMRITIVGDPYVDSNSSWNKRLTSRL